MKVEQNFKQLISYIKHRYILGQKKCPKCGEWSNYIGPVWFTGLDEYKCRKCNKYFQS